jgi:hypothetical protein
MDCRKFKRNLEDYLQGGLDFPGRFGMERHARQCLGCGREVDEAHALGNLAHSLDKVKAPAGFEEALMRRIQQERPRRKSRLLDRLFVFGFEWPSLRTVALVASVAVVAVTAVFVANQYWGGIVAPVASTETLPGSQLAVPLQSSRIPPSAVSSASEPVIEPVPASLSGRRINPAGYFDSDRGFVPGVAEPADSEFIEYRVPGSGDQPVIMRLPARVRMRFAHPTEEYFIRNISH